MIRIIKDKERKLNIWVDYDDHRDCYCDNNELLLLFTVYARQMTRYGASKAVIKDFQKTCKELNDFYFEIINNKFIYYVKK